MCIYIYTPSVDVLGKYPKLRGFFPPQKKKVRILNATIDKLVDGEKNKKKKVGKTINSVLEAYNHSYAASKEVSLKLTQENGYIVCISSMSISLKSKTLFIKSK